VASELGVPISKEAVKKFLEAEGLRVSERDLDMVVECLPEMI